MLHRKLKDMLRGSIVCRNMDEICSVWRIVEGLEANGILEGARVTIFSVTFWTIQLYPFVTFLCYLFLIDSTISCGCEEPLSGRCA